MNYVYLGLAVLAIAIPTLVLVVLRNNRSSMSARATGFINNLLLLAQIGFIITLVPIGIPIWGAILTLLLYFPLSIVLAWQLYQKAI